jgi:hypothetical protein
MLVKKKESIFITYGQNFMHTDDLTRYKKMFEKPKIDECRHGADEFLHGLIKKSIYPVKSNIRSRQNSLKTVEINEQTDTK